MADQRQGPAHAVDDAQRKHDEQVLQDRMKYIRRKLLVLSGKGGVGKSTVAANLAVALAQSGRHVGLLDIDVHGPSIPHVLGLDGHQIAIAGEALLPVRVSEQLVVMSIGFLLPDRVQPVIWRGPRKYSLIRQFLKDVAWGHLDYLVVDSPPGTGDEPLAIAQLVGSPAAAVIVTTPQDLAIADVRRCVSFCNAVSLPVAGIVENMSGLVCPTCGERIDVFKRGGGKALADEMNVPFLGTIPIHPEIVASCDAGTPLAAAHRQNPISRAFAGIVHAILAGQEPEGTVTVGQHEAEEDHLMKIAIPVEAGRVSMHFGHCTEFVVYEVDKDNKTILGKASHTPPPHEPGVLPGWLHELGVNVIIAGGMGQRAQQLFAQNGIEVVVGSPSADPEQVAIAHLNGTLQPGDNVCDH
jgi:ATP-binding protein involved in chromosome partitioning